MRLPLTLGTVKLLHVGTIAEYIQVCDIPSIVKLKFREVALDFLGLYVYSNSEVLILLKTLKFLCVICKRTDT